MATTTGTTFTTPFKDNTITLKKYLTGQAAFSTAIGFVCKLPLLQSAVMGLAVEGCRYATDKALSYLSEQIPFINSNKTVVKAALVAGSFFMAHKVINAVLPGTSCLFRASLLMTATYLFAEPVAGECSKAYSSDTGIRTTFTNIKNRIHNHYKNNDMYKKIISLWVNINPFE